MTQQIVSTSAVNQLFDSVEDLPEVGNPLTFQLSAGRPAIMGQILDSTDPFSQVLRAIPTTRNPKSSFARIASSLLK